MEHWKINQCIGCNKKVGQKPGNRIEISNQNTSHRNEKNQQIASERILICSITLKQKKNAFWKKNQSFLEGKISKLLDKICYQKLFWPFNLWKNWSSEFCKSFFRSLEHFFITVGQNNFGNKIPNFYLGKKFHVRI